MMPSTLRSNLQAQNSKNLVVPEILSATIVDPIGVLGFISARQHICYSALYAIARPSVRPSVCLSVCLSVPLSVTRVDQSKTVTVRITQPSPQSSPMTLVS